MDENRSYRGLRVSGIFGKKPIIGLAMFVIGSLIFIILAYNLVKQGPLIQWDLPLAEWFHAFALNSSPLMTDIMIAGYYFGYGIWIAAILFTLYFFYKRYWRELVIGIVSLGGSGLIFLILSNIFKRPRPSSLFDELIWSGSLTIPGFPSGHAKSILILCGFLVYLLMPKIKSSLGKVLAVLFALVVVVYVGFSRLYVGDHYLTDIIAGYAVGIAWFGLVFTSIEWLFQRHALRKERESLF